MNSHSFQKPICALALLGLSSSAVAVVSGVEEKGSEPISRSTVRLIISMKDRASGQCTGSLIADHLILTAAHCLEEKPTAVRIDFYCGAGKFESRAVSRYLLHPGRDHPRDGEGADLALLYFAGTTPAGHAPIGAGDAPALESLLFISGFGMTNVDPDTYQESDRDDSVLRSAVLSVIASEGDTLEFKDKLGRAASCFGDSGGPAWIDVDGKPLLVGVSSRLRPPICKNSSFYTSVSFHGEWLREASRTMLAPPPYLLGNFRAALGPKTARAWTAELRRETFDDERLLRLQAALRRLPKGTGIAGKDAYALLATFSLDESRIDALEALRPSLRLRSRKEGRQVIEAFKYYPYKLAGRELLGIDGINEF